LAVREERSAALALGESLRIQREIIRAYGTLFVLKTKLSEMSGLIGAGQATVMIANDNRQNPFRAIVFVIVLVGALSTTVGWFNLIPILPLDGGRVTLNLAEWIGGFQCSRIWEERLCKAGVAALLVLTVVSTGNDLYRLFAS